MRQLVVDKMLALVLLSGLISMVSSQKDEACKDHACHGEICSIDNIPCKSPCLCVGVGSRLGHCVSSVFCNQCIPENCACQHPGPPCCKDLQCLDGSNKFSLTEPSTCKQFM